jgi:uncharacterized oligopeptide transporter (OPT) family protein
MAQTAGTAAGEIGFMCIVLAAIDMLNDRPGLGFSLHLTGLQIFLWLTFAGLLGAFLAVPLRRHYIDEENLTFADGTAAGETLVVLYQGARAAAVRVRALFGAMGLSALVALLRPPPLLVSRGWAARETFADVLRWVMWPATGLLVAGGITALVGGSSPGASARCARPTRRPVSSRSGS